MDEFNLLIQALLLKKEKECEKMTYLTSRISQENIIHIDNIRDEVAAICKSVNLPIEQKNLHENSRCINAYKFLAFNTNFKCLELLAQDDTNTHLVDICPLLSQYLFIEILWRLHYEDILAESILYMPLDFAIEVIEIARSCVDMFHFDRASRFISNLTIQAYKKLLLIKLNGSQTTDMNSNIEKLVTNIQELLSVLSTESFLQFERLKDSEKYARTGIILKNLLNVIITCLKFQHEPPVVSSTLEKCYKITFGHDPLQKCDESLLDQYFETICKDMMDLLLKKIKEVDCYCYIEWVEIDDIEQPMITLQKAVGLRCYELLEIMTNDEKLKEKEHLLECLKQISSKPNPEEGVTLLSLEDLINGANEGKMECTREIFKRCRYWDEETLDEIKKHTFVIDEQICLKLLDYLVFLKSDNQKESFIRKVYLYTMSLMLQLESTSFIKTIISFILKYDGSDILENPNTETSFKYFVIRNPNLSVEKDFKQAFLYLLKNAKKYMELFIKVFLGHAPFQDTMLPLEDLVKFAPFLAIRDNENNYLALAALRNILLEDQIALPSHVFTLITSCTCIKKHDIVNVVLTPFLMSNKYPQKNLVPLMKLLKQICFYLVISEVDLKNLFHGITKKLWYARNNTSDFRSNNFRVITAIKDFLKIRHNSSSTMREHNYPVLQLVEQFLEPVDRCYFIDKILNWYLYLPLDHMIKDYEKRFFCAKYKIMNSNKIPQELKDSVANYGLLVEDFLRHLILHASIEEGNLHQSIKDKYFNSIPRVPIEKYIVNLTCVSIMTGDCFVSTIYCLRSYNDVIKIIMQACQLCLEYPDDFAIGTFSQMLELYAEVFKASQDCRLGKISELNFVEGFSFLANTINGTPYVDLYSVATDRLNELMAAEDPINLVDDLRQVVLEFSRSCNITYVANDYRYVFSNPHTAVVAKYRLAYNIVNASMKITNMDIMDCLLRARQSMSV